MERVAGIYDNTKTYLELASSCDLHCPDLIPFLNSPEKQPRFRETVILHTETGNGMTPRNPQAPIFMKLPDIPSF